MFEPSGKLGSNFVSLEKSLSLNLKPSYGPGKPVTPLYLPAFLFQQQRAIFKIYLVFIFQLLLFRMEHPWSNLSPELRTAPGTELVLHVDWLNKARPRAEATQLLCSQPPKSQDKNKGLNLKHAWGGKSTSPGEQKRPLMLFQDSEMTVIIYLYTMKQKMAMKSSRQWDNNVNKENKT